MAVETSRQSQPNRQRRAGERKPAKRAPNLLRKALPSLPYVIGGVLLVAYFVWMVIQMSSDAPGGGSVPLSIFGAVLLGVLAGAASILSSRRRQK